MEPFRIDVPDAVLDDLRDRLLRTRWPAEIKGVGWDRGTDPAYLRDLVAYWADGFDWRAQEARMNELPQFRADGLHFVHQAGEGLPVLLLHGWPDSFLRYEKVLPLLAGRPVVVPSLPGYGFSDPPAEPGQVTRSAMAARMATLMESLGYDRYAVSGGDIGNGTAEALAGAHPDRVAGLHLTDLALWHLTGLDPTTLSGPERDYLAAAAAWARTDGAYLQLQATRQLTAAYGLTDSPAGLAGWIVEKLRAWSDGFPFSRDEVLTHVTLYWVTNTIGSSFGPYAERETVAPFDRVTVPAAVSQFAFDTLHAPREYAER
ncbi:MAG TPA: epoxide hydrolase, partial [Mycobacteriales bacterium]|nr:epoxide hydrolase [Mycobacteriales bacterium]